MAETDLISRQAAIDALDKTCDVVCEYSKKQRSAMCRACTLGNAFDVLEALPSTQPERKKGKWIFNNLNDGNGIVYHCTCCNWFTKHNLYAYCPNCGADMRGNENV